MNHRATIEVSLRGWYQFVGLSVLLLASSLVLATGISVVENRSTDPKELAIRRVVTTYIEATDEQQLTRLNTVMHQAYRTIWNRFYGDAVMVLTRRQYIDHVRKDDIGGVPRTIRFDTIEVVSTIALVRLTLESRGLTYTCFISLIEDTSGRWWVVEDLPYLKRF